MPEMKASLFNPSAVEKCKTLILARSVICCQAGSNEGIRVGLADQYV
jgi:hypothetical protein